MRCIACGILGTRRCHDSPSRQNRGTHTLQNRSNACRGCIRLCKKRWRQKTRKDDSTGTHSPTISPTVPVLPTFTEPTIPTQIIDNNCSLERRYGTKKLPNTDRNELDRFAKGIVQVFLNQWQYCTLYPITWPVPPIFVTIHTAGRHNFRFAGGVRFGTPNATMSGMSRYSAPLILALLASISVP